MQWTPMLLLAGACSVVALGCQKDASIGGSGAETDTDTGPVETESAADEIGTETETETDDGANFVPDETETETGEPVEPKTCREMLDCVFMCLAGGDLGLECLETCGEGFDPAEAQKAGDLVLCIGQICVENEKCVLSDLSAEECIGCIGFGLFLPEPPGCEEPAAACQ